MLSRNCLPLTKESNQILRHLFTTLEFSNGLVFTVNWYQQHKKAGYSSDTRYFWSKPLGLEDQVTKAVGSFDCHGCCLIVFLHKARWEQHAFHTAHICSKCPNERLLSQAQEGCLQTHYWTQMATLEQFLTEQLVGCEFIPSADISSLNKTIVAGIDLDKTFALGNCRSIAITTGPPGGRRSCSSRGNINLALSSCPTLSSL